MSGGLPFDEPPGPERPANAGASSPRPGSRLAPLSVTALNELSDAVVSESIGAVWVEGEVSRFIAHASGHWYFTLTEGADASMPCVMWRTRNARLRFRPENGMAVLLLATPHVYAAQGKLQLVVDAIEPAGAGAAALALEQLKQRLAAEGLFDPARKKPLPLLPHRVGIVTSIDGAALRDVLNVLRRRFAGVSVLIVPAAVQGAGAPAEIASALRAIDARGLDVLLLVRGGGAREDLAAFDDERVVRAVAACATPIVTGVGHEIDTTLVDYAADVRAATPSAAAELVVRERVELASRIAQCRALIERCARHAIETARRRRASALAARGFRDLPRRIGRARMHAAGLERRIDATVRMQVRALGARLRLAQTRLSPAHRLAALGQSRRRLDAVRGRLDAAAHAVLSTNRRRLGTAAAKLDALSPLAVLGRGFALATRQGAILRRAADVAPGDTIDVRLADGSLTAEVRTTRAPGPRDVTKGPPR